MRRHVTYANVAATLALVFAMTGGALAANHYLINSTKQINPKVLKKLHGAKGKTGATGRTGATGKEGAPGKEGPAGQNAVIASLSWTTLPLENGWVVFSEFGAPGYAKDAAGFVHLRGAIGGEKRTSEDVAVLPPGFRPTGPAALAVLLRGVGSDGEGNPQLVDLIITKEGQIIAEPGKSATEKLVSLEGLEFFAG